MIMSSDYERGYKDCERGYLAEDRGSEEYQNGYARRHEEEQQLTHQTETDND